MILFIQQKIAELVMEFVKLDPNSVYQEELIDDIYQELPFVEIIPGNASISLAWDNPQYFQNQRFQQKYSVLQPINIKIVYSDKLQLENALTLFLNHLPRYISLNQQAIELIPGSLNYKFTKGKMDWYQAELTVDSKYLIYTGKTQVPNIKDIAFTEVYVEKGSLKESNNQ
ncbi:MAG: hypothetical protein ACRCTQ_05175 [Brevinemataceae bacterium]